MWNNNSKEKIRIVTCLILIVIINFLSKQCFADFQWKKTWNRNIINVKWKAEVIQWVKSDYKNNKSKNQNISTGNYIYNSKWDRCEKSYWDCKLLNNWDLKWNRLIKTNWDICIWRLWNCEIKKTWEIICNNPKFCSIQYTKTINSIKYIFKENSQINNKCIINYLDQYEKILLKSIIYKKLKDKISSEDNLETIFSENKNISKYTKIKKSYFDNKIWEIDNSDKKNLFIEQSSIKNIENKNNLKYININKWSFLLHKQYYENKTWNLIQKYIINSLTSQLNDITLSEILDKPINKLFSSTYKSDEKEDIKKMVFKIISELYKKFLNSERNIFLKSIISNCEYNSQGSKIECKNNEYFYKIAKNEILLYIIEQSNLDNNQIQNNINDNPNILLYKIQNSVNSYFIKYESWNSTFIKESDIHNLCWKQNPNESELETCKNNLLEEINKKTIEWIYLNNEKISLIDIDKIDKKININFFMQKIENLYKKYIVQDVFLTKFYNKFNNTWAIIKDHKIKYPEWFIDIIKDKNCDSLNILQIKEQDNNLFFIDWKNIIFDKKIVSINTISKFLKDIWLKNKYWKNIFLKTKDLKFKKYQNKKNLIFAIIYKIKNFFKLIRLI